MCERRGEGRGSVAGSEEWLSIGKRGKRGGGREEGGRGSNTFIDIDGSETTTKRPSPSSLLCQDIQTAIYTAG